MTRHTATALPSALPRDLAQYLGNQHTLPAVSVWAVRFAVLVSKWATRKRTRMALRHLTPEQLADVGLTPRDALIEQRRAFWRG